MEGLAGFLTTGKVLISDIGLKRDDFSLWSWFGTDNWFGTLGWRGTVTNRARAGPSSRGRLAVFQLEGTPAEELLVVGLSAHKGLCLWTRRSLRARR